MSRLLGRASRRYLLRHPGILSLTVVGVALGVAVVVSIQVALQSARASFRLSAETVAGRTTHRIQAGPTRLPDSLLAQLRIDVGVRESAPVVEELVTASTAPGRALTLLGVDPLSEMSFRPGLSDFQGEGGVDAASAVWVPEDLLPPGAAGDSLELVGPTTRVRFPAVPLARADGAGADILVMDIAAAQRFLERPGLDHIDLILPDTSLLEDIRPLLPSDARIVPAGTRVRAMAEMIRAFDLNLTALSLLALLFGMFLIYNAETFAVVQRREIFARLRSIGVTAAELRDLVLWEAVGIGVIGSLLGVAAGLLIAKQLVLLVSRTINDLYVAVAVNALAPDPGFLAFAIALGTATSVLSAVPAIREATGVTPTLASARSMEEERAATRVTRVAGVGIGAAVLGGAVLAVPGERLDLAFVGTFLTVLALALVAPAAASLLFRGVARGARGLGGVTGALVSRGLLRSLSRTAPAISALVVAVAVAVGLGTMVTSFRGTLIRWLDQTLQADVYVSAPARGSTRVPGRLDPEVVAALRSAPGVAASSTYLASEGVSEDPAVRVVALDLARPGEAAFTFRAEERAVAFARFRSGGALFVSEPYAMRYRVSPGDSVSLRTPDGPRAFPVAAVFYDYASEHGTLIMSRGTWDAHWSEPAVNSVALFGAPGVDTGRLLAAARGAARQAEGLSIRSNRTLRASTLRVFDRTFTVTSVLRILTLGVAFIGVLGALMALQLERAWEVALLRATGVTPSGVGRLLTTETGILGLVSGLLALPAGWIMAWLMVGIINRRSFGWTLFMELEPRVFLEGVGVALIGSLLAGLYPAWRLARMPPARALGAE